MLDEWGSVDGDTNADVIIHDRRQGRRDANYTGLANFALVAGFAIWYAMTGSNTALALEIIAAAWLAVSGVNREIYRTHTMVLIAERRAQLMEQKLQALSMDLFNLQRK